MTKICKILSSQCSQIKWQCITQSILYIINVNQWPWPRTSKRETGEQLAKNINLVSLEITARRLKICQIFISSVRLYIRIYSERTGGGIMDL